MNLLIKLIHCCTDKTLTIRNSEILLAPESLTKAKNHQPVTLKV